MKRLFKQFLKEQGVGLHELVGGHYGKLSAKFATWRSKYLFMRGGDKVNKFQIRKWVENAPKA